MLAADFIYLGRRWDFGRERVQKNQNSKRSTQNSLYCICLRNDLQKVGKNAGHLKAVFGLLARPILSYVFFKWRKKGVPKTRYTVQ
jgi:hypothetical protein